MKNLFLLFLIPAVMNAQMIFDFNENADLSNWLIVNDVVMGGRSNSSFGLNPEGHAMFSGDVSLENNGGFASVRYRFPKMEVGAYKKIRIRCKGDGKRYQFRVKDNSDHYYTFIAHFETTGEWETIEIELNTLYPNFRGRKLDMANFHGEFMEEIGILIANKKAEGFELLIDRIELE